MYMKDLVYCLCMNHKENETSCTKLKKNKKIFQCCQSKTVCPKRFPRFEKAHFLKSISYERFIVVTASVTASRNKNYFSTSKFKAVKTL